MPIGKVRIYRSVRSLFVFVCFFVCTVTDFAGDDKARGAKFCTLVHRRLRKVTSLIRSPNAVIDTPNRQPLRDFFETVYTRTKVLTVASIHWFSRMAPQQPRKPRMKMMTPTTINTHAPTLIACANSPTLATSAKLPSSTFAQIPTANRAPPTSYTDTQTQ